MSDVATRLTDAVQTLRERTRIPGVAVGLLHGGERHVVCGGVTHVDHPLPVDATTRYQIASLTKPFTAAALLRLVDRGLVDLERPVRDSLPELRLPREEWTGRVRVRDLLTHTGGWQGDRFFVRPTREPTLEALVAEFADNEQLTPPGTHWSYNNAGFSVAGRLIEVTTGTPFDAALRELVLDPLGLAHSCLRADEAIHRRVAAPHLVARDGPVFLPGGGWQPGWELQPLDWPAGGLISCVEDLLDWARFHLGDGRAPDGTRLLEAETLHCMQRETGPAGGDDDAMGLAWLLRDLGGVRFFGHTGSTVGYLSQILMQRERDFALVILTNSVNDEGFRRDLIEQVLAFALGLDVRDPEPLAPQPDPGEYLGRFAGPFWTARVEAADAPGELVLHAEAYPPEPGRWTPPAAGPTRWAFYAPDRIVVTAPEASRGARADYVRDDTGRVAWLRWGGRLARAIA